MKLLLNRLHRLVKFFKLKEDGGVLFGKLESGGSAHVYFYVVGKLLLDFFEVFAAEISGEPCYVQRDLCVGEHMLPHRCGLCFLKIRNSLRHIGILVCNIPQRKVIPPFKIFRNAFFRNCRYRFLGIAGLPKPYIRERHPNFIFWRRG